MKINKMFFWVAGIPVLLILLIVIIARFEPEGSHIARASAYKLSLIHIFRSVMQQAENNRRFGARTIVFVDEIHRFNKAQQDAFLPLVEKGSIILIGATTENPSFEINGALLSRCKVFVLQPLGREDLVGLLKRALTDERGFGRQKMCIRDSS